LAEIKGKFDNPVDLDYNDTVLNGTIISSSKHTSSQDTMQIKEEDNRPRRGREILETGLNGIDSTHYNMPLDLMINGEMPTPLSYCTASANILSAITNVPRDSPQSLQIHLTSIRNVQNNRLSSRVLGNLGMNSDPTRQGQDFVPLSSGSVVSSVDGVDGGRCWNGVHSENSAALKQEVTDLSGQGINMTAYSYPTLG